MDTTLTTPRGPLTIRATTEDDAPAFRDLRLEALRTQPEAFSADYEANVDQPLAYWIERVRPDPGGNGIIYVAVAEETLVGMCGVRRGASSKTAHSGLIWGVYVRPAWRGLRVAEALINHCIAWAQLREVTIVKLGVAATNGSAIRAYLRSGFSVYGVEPQAIFYDGVAYDELLMARRL